MLYINLYIFENSDNKNKLSLELSPFEILSAAVRINKILLYLLMQDRQIQIKHSVHQVN